MQSAEYSWEHIYKRATFQLPDNALHIRGRRVILTSYVDANLYHDFVTGCSVTGILHFFNKTPGDWFSKKQSTVETATYGSEYVAARTAVEQIMDLVYTFCYLGVDIYLPVMLFGDNKSVVNSLSIPTSKLQK